LIWAQGAEGLQIWVKHQILGNHLFFVLGHNETNESSKDTVDIQVGIFEPWSWVFQVLWTSQRAGTSPKLAQTQFSMVLSTRIPVLKNHGRYVVFSLHANFQLKVQKRRKNWVNRDFFIKTCSNNQHNSFHSFIQS
jgi:hypothetical protein